MLSAAISVWSPISVPERFDQICETWYARYKILQHPNAVLINTLQSAISESTQDAQICGRLWRFFLYVCYYSSSFSSF
jgi:hypothetical protein